MISCDIITVGQTKTIRDCAVGAICRAGGECFVPCDITLWSDKNGRPFGTPIPLIREHLKNRLDSEGFGNITLLQSPTFTTVKDKSTGRDRIIGHRIPSVRFPSWMRCLKCGLLHYLPWRTYETEHQKRPNSVEVLRCRDDSCRGKLEFITWVLISSEGYLDDIPWSFLAHRNVRAVRADNQARDCKDRNQLYLNRNNSGRLQIRCHKCNSQPADLGGIAKQKFFSGLSWMYKQPWLKERVEIDELLELPVAVKITDTRVHMPDVVAALDIPPESRIDENDLRARIAQLDDWTFIKSHKPIDLSQHKRLIKRMARYMNVEKDQMLTALNDLERGWPKTCETKKTVTGDLEMIEAEYGALCTRYNDFKENERFITEHQTDAYNDLIKSPDIAPRAYSSLKVVERLVIVKRLREIQVFCGFGRYKNAMKNRPALGNPTDWLPACELYGEGIFFTLDQEKLNQWETTPQCMARSEIIAQRMENSIVQRIVPSPRFILLHTIAHILIKQLEFSAGYPVSSLREKIFCSDKKEAPMAGILIYVVVPNKLGSLGGLAEHGKPVNFINLWLKTMEKAEYCTYDPICFEHEGQGPGQLNRAACHGCALLPEITCIYNNCLLDRQFIVGRGKGKDEITGFMPYIQRVHTEAEPRLT